MAKKKELKACVSKLEAHIDKLNRDIDDLQDTEHHLREEHEKLIESISSCRSSHSALMRGIKRAIGIGHWPKMEDKFPEAAIELLNKYIQDLKDQIERLEYPIPSSGELLGMNTWAKEEGELT